MEDLLFREIIETFEFSGEFKESYCHKVGNINDTYVVTFKEGEILNRYILQKINKNVFPFPKELMKNLEGVTSHIAKKVLEESGEILRESLNLVLTNSGKSYHVTENGEFWRAFVFIEGAKTYMKVEKPEHIYETGKAIGKFQKQLSDFNAADLFEVIKDFHNTPKRFRDLIKAIEKDSKGRVDSALEEIAFIMNRADELAILTNLLDDGKLPLRCTHNDTKFNNVMIDNKTGKALCMIDLDTVMPGLSLYDFGDAIRSGCSTTEEEELDLSKVNFDLNLYENFIKGLLKESRETLNRYEIENIAFSAKILTLELAMRFLTDYLNGDIYFKVQRKQQNLERTRNQLKLAHEIEKNLDRMNRIVEKYA